MGTKRVTMTVILGQLNPEDVQQVANMMRLVSRTFEMNQWSQLLRLGLVGALTRQIVADLTADPELVQSDEDKKAAVAYVRDALMAAIRGGLGDGDGERPRIVVRGGDA